MSLKRTPLAPVAAAFGAGIALSALAVAPSVGETIWSPYQKLVGHPITFRVNPAGAQALGYLVNISDVFYQIAVDLRPAAVALASAV